jgi:hypothetical protein
VLLLNVTFNSLTSSLPSSQSSSVSSLSFIWICSFFCSPLYTIYKKNTEHPVFFTPYEEMLKVNLTCGLNGNAPFSVDKDCQEEVLFVVMVPELAHLETWRVSNDLKEFPSN